MGKCYCDYCDVFLTNDSVAVRKQHNEGNRHKYNVCEYYRQYVGQQLQDQIEQIVDQFEMKVSQGLIRPTYGLPPPSKPQQRDTTTNINTKQQSNNTNNNNNNNNSPNNNNDIEKDIKPDNENINNNGDIKSSSSPSNNIRHSHSPLQQQQQQQQQNKAPINTPQNSTQNRDVTVPSSSS